jgi:hypothetical protein
MYLNASIPGSGYQWAVIAYDFTTGQSGGMWAYPGTAQETWAAPAVLEAYNISTSCNQTPHGVTVWDIGLWQNDTSNQFDENPVTYRPTAGNNNFSGYPSCFWFSSTTGTTTILN